MEFPLKLYAVRVSAMLNALCFPYLLEKPQFGGKFDGFHPHSVFSGVVKFGFLEFFRNFFSKASKGTGFSN